jgi:23S rRNA pseudouridine2605 synthase
MEERLQKVLAGAGVASRREAESLISSGKVTVNGVVVKELGHKVDPVRDTVAVEGQGIARAVPFIYVLLHKPKGYVTTRKDPHATNTVMDLIIPPLEAKLGKRNPSVAGLHPVGRLDAQSEGLLILTNDGAFTQTLTHPSHQVSKLYQAEVRGIPDQAAIEKMRTGVPLFGQRTLPARVRVVKVDRSRNTARVEVEIREGRNQQVRRMLQAVGVPVDRLVRTAIGPVSLSRLRPGQWRFLTDAEVALLQKRAAPLDDVAASDDASRKERRIGQAPQGGSRHRPAGPRRPKPTRDRGDTPQPTTRPATGSRPAPQKPPRDRGARPRPTGPAPRDRSAGPRHAGPPPRDRDAGPRPAGPRPTGPRPRQNTGRPRAGGDAGPRGRGNTRKP